MCSLFFLRLRTPSSSESRHEAGPGSALARPQPLGRGFSRPPPSLAGARRRTARSAAGRGARLATPPSLSLGPGGRARSLPGPGLASLALLRGATGLSIGPSADSLGRPWRPCPPPARPRSGREFLMSFLFWRRGRARRLLVSGDAPPRSWEGTAARPSRPGARLAQAVWRPRPLTTCLFLSSRDSLSPVSVPPSGSRRTPPSRLRRGSSA